MFGYTADKSLSGVSSRRVNLDFTSRQSGRQTVNYGRCIVTSCRNEVFHRRTAATATAAGPSCLVAAKR